MITMIKVVELCAGAGGLALGFEKAGLEHELLVEIDKDCVATLHKNRPDGNVLHADIKEVEDFHASHFHMQVKS